MELSLYVKVCDDEDMKIPVKTSYTIEEIKTQIESLKEIPAKDQILTLNGVDLENIAKLTKDQIENSVVWLSYQSKEISLHIFENWRTKKETFKLEIDWDETISAIKTRVVTDLIGTDQIRSKNHFFGDLDLILDQILSM